METLSRCNIIGIPPWYNVIEITSWCNRGKHLCYRNHIEIILHITIAMMLSYKEMEIKS